MALLSPAASRGATACYLVHVSVDGLTARYLRFYVTNAPAQFPSFHRLQTKGAFTYNARCDYDYSETVPNHVTILTGRPVLKPQGLPATVHHGYTNNIPAPMDTIHRAGNTNVAYKASFFDVAHDHGLNTAFYASKTRLTICERSYNEFYGAPDLVGDDNGRDKIDAELINNGPMAPLVDDLEQRLSNDPPHYAFIHLTEPDTTGHAFGWDSSAWSNAVRSVDQQLARILASISAPFFSNRVVLLVAADHGGGGVTPESHSEAWHPDNYTTPFFLWGAGIPAGADLYTLLANRADPGTNRVDYTQSPQPLRNGDAGNLALALLGLPPIPGSFMTPVLVWPEARLAVTRTERGFTLSWPGTLASFVLERATFLSGGPTAWERVTNDIVWSEGRRSCWVPDGADSPGFFRLRQ